MFSLPKMTTRLALPQRSYSLPNARYLGDRRASTQASQNDALNITLILPRALHDSATLLHHVSWVRQMLSCAQPTRFRVSVHAPG